MPHNISHSPQASGQQIMVNKRCTFILFSTFVSMFKNIGYMNLKNIYFSWLIQWSKLKVILNPVAEIIILLASLTSLFVLIYQFGFVQTTDSIHTIRDIYPFLLLTFFTGITLRYIVKSQEIISCCSPCCPARCFSRRPSPNPCPISPFSPIRYASIRSCWD